MLRKEATIRAADGTTRQAVVELSVVGDDVLLESLNRVVSAHILGYRTHDGSRVVAVRTPVVDATT